MAVTLAGAHLSGDNRSRNVVDDIYKQIIMVVAFDKDGRTNSKTKALFNIGLPD